MLKRIVEPALRVSVLSWLSRDILSVDLYPAIVCQTLTLSLPECFSLSACIFLFPCLLCSDVEAE